MSALENLKFDLKDSSYADLADALKYWAEMFWEGTIQDEHGDNIAYLLYNMSKEMRNVE